MDKPKVAVVVLNYNGKKLLQQFLPSIVSNSDGATIYVVDNASTDDSLSFLEKEFPQIKCIVLHENLGFAEGYNIGVKQIVADYFILINSDVEVTPNWIKPVIDLMETDKTIAACQPKILSFTNKDEFEYAGACGGFIDTYGYPFCRGRIFNTIEKDSGQYNDAAEIFWATGACMFVRAEVFNDLRGFDNKYFAHMEEIDLCWRMKNTGNKIMVVPSSVVYHLGGGTLNKLSPLKTYLNFRNNLLTLAKNYPNALWIFIVFIRLVLDGVAGLKFLTEGKPMHTLAVVRAHIAFYFYLPRALGKRFKMRSHKNYKPDYKQMYRRNMVVEYYLRKKLTFTQQDKSRFN